MAILKRLFTETKVLLRSVPSGLVAIFAVAVVSMNLLANKSIDLNLDWLALDCGIFFSWVAFLVMDIITRRYGVKAANTLSIIALLINIGVSLLFLVVSFIPGTWSQSYVEGSENIINTALNGTLASSWYVILGSSTAFIVSAFVNNFLNHFIAKAIGKKNFLAFSVSSYVSTFIGQFIDNLLFALIVSLHFFGWTFVQCITCAVTGALAELVCEIIFSPFGYRIVQKMDKENVGKEYLDLIKGDPICQ